MGWRTASACSVPRAHPKCTAMYVVYGRGMPQESADGERVEQGLAAAGPAGLESCSVTHTRLSRQGAPLCTKGPPFLVPGSLRSQPLISGSRGGEPFFNACLLRRTHQVMKSCPASVATASPHLDAESVPAWSAVGTGCSSPRFLSGCVLLQSCPRPRPREPASRHLPLSHTPRRLPHHAHHPASCKAAPLIPTLPARQEGPGPPFSVKWLPARLPKTLPELVTKSELGALPGDNKWGGFLLRAHAVTSYSTGQHTTTPPRAASSGG